MSNPAPTLNQINAFNATQGTTIDFNIIGGTEVIRSNKIYIYDLSDNSLICTHLYVSTESIHELPANTDSSIVYESGKSSADFVNGAQYYAQIQTFTDTAGTQGGSGLSIAKLFWCLPTPTLTLSTIPTTISTTSYNVSATYTPNTSGGATNEIQEFQFNLYSAIGALLQTSGVVLYGEGVDLSYNFSGLEVDSTYYVTLDVTTTQGMNVSAQSNTFTVSIDTPTMGSASVVNNGCDGYISVTSNLSSEYEHEESAGAGEIMSFTTDSVNDITELDVDFSPVQDGTPWMSAQDTEPYMFRPVPTQTEDFGHESGTIVGGTVGWNQLVQNGNFADVSGWTASRFGLSVANNVATLTALSTVAQSGAIYRNISVPAVVGHKYLYSLNIAPSRATTARVVYDSFGIIGDTNINASENILQGIASPSSVNHSGYLYVYPNRGGALVEGDTVALKDFWIVDLTQMFGTTIADYVYTLEQGTAGAGVAWLRANAPQLFEYHAYDAGSLVSVSGLTSHDMVGFNQLDPTSYIIDGASNYNKAVGSQLVGEGSSATVSGTNPITVGVTAAWRGATFISEPLVYGNNYQLTCTISAPTIGDKRVSLMQIDEDDTVLSCHNFSGNSSDNLARTVVPKAQGARVALVVESVTAQVVTVNDLCLHLSWDGERDGEYEEYTKHSYPLDSTLTLRGIPKLDANNNLYYDGDTYASDGTITRKYGFVDLGTLTWYWSDSYKLFYANISNQKVSPHTATPNAMCDSYPTMSFSALDADHTIQKGFTVYKNSEGSSGYVDIRDASKEGMTSAQFKQAMSGIYAVYELATPTTETADPYTNPQIVDPHGTEQYVGSPIPVGHETTYQRICPISGWDSVEVDVVGKNLLNPNFSDYGETYNYRVLMGVVKSGESARFTLTDKDTSVDVSGCYIGFCYDDVLSSGSPSEYRWCVSNGTIQNDMSNLSIRNVRLSNVFVYPKDEATFNKIFSRWNVMVEYGSTASAFEPYNTNSTTYTSTLPKYKQQVSQDKIPYITKNIGDTYADTLTENLVGGTIAWNQSVPDTTTTHTVSGSIASMDDAVAGNFESVVCDIEPFQDLHGYDKPWVGGAGKNKVDPTSFDSAQFSDSNGVYSNTLTDTRDYFDMILRAYKSDNTYVVVASKTITQAGVASATFTPTSDIVAIWITHNGAQNNLNCKFLNCKLQANQQYTFSFNVIGADPKTVGGLSFKEVQIETGSTATAFEPYANLCPITGWTGCEVDVSGVNLLDEQWELGSLNSSGNKVSGDASIRTANYIPVRPSTSYYFKCPNGTGTGRTCFYDANKVHINADVAFQANAIFTTPSNARYMMFVMATSYGTTYNNDISVNYPSTDTTYHAHNPNSAVYPVSWQTEAGTVYGGTVDLVTGVLTVTHGFKTFDGSEDWRASSNANRYYVDYDSTTFPYKWAADVFAISNKYDYYGIRSSSTYLPDGKFMLWAPALFPIAQTLREIIVHDSGVGSLANFKASLSNSPLQVVYELATPQTYQLDPVQVACLLGQNNVWADCGDVSVTYPTNHSYQSLSTTHKYYKRLNGVESISVGSDVVVDVGTDNIIDLTQMFGTTIADYIYNTEQSSSSGMGVKFFKSLFPNDDYDYNSGELISVNASAHVIKDANGNVVNTYPLDSDLVLRGIPKLDANNKLYYDGDVYEPDGTVTRNYAELTLNGTETWNISSGNLIYTVLVSQVSGEANVAVPAITSKLCIQPNNSLASLTDTSKECVIRFSSGGNLIALFLNMVGVASASSLSDFKTWLASNPITVNYKKPTTTTEQADPFEENQTIIPNGIEEYIVTEQGDVEMPVGHDSTYYATEVYGGMIDMASGILMIDRKIVDLGTLTWNYNSSYGVFWGVISDKKNNETNVGLCSEYPLVNGNATSLVNADAQLTSDKTAILSKDTSAPYIFVRDSRYTDVATLGYAMNGVQLVYELATPIEISLTPQQMQTLSGQNNIWSNTNGGMYLVYQLPITSLLVKRRDVADVSGKWLTLYSTPITQASDMDFTFIDFLNQYGKTYQYALVPVLAQDQSGVVVQIEGGYTVSDNVDSIFDGVYIADQTNVERVKAGVGYGNIDMNQGVGSITPIGSKYPIVITNSQNQYHNGSVRGTIVPNDFYSNGNLSRIDMVNKRDELEQFLTNKRAKIIKDWNGNIWLVMIMSNVACSFDDNYGMGMVSFSADWLEVGDPTNQQDLYNAGLINVGGV